MRFEISKTGKEIQTMQKTLSEKLQQTELTKHNEVKKLKAFKEYNNLSELKEDAVNKITDVLHALENKEYFSIPFVYTTYCYKTLPDGKFEKVYSNHTTSSFNEEQLANIMQGFLRYEKIKYYDSSWHYNSNTFRVESMRLNSDNMHYGSTYEENIYKALDRTSCIAAINNAFDAAELMLETDKWKPKYYINSSLKEGIKSIISQYKKYKKEFEKDLPEEEKFASPIEIYKYEPIRNTYIITGSPDSELFNIYRNSTKNEITQCAKEMLKHGFDQGPLTIYKIPDTVPEQELNKWEEKSGYAAIKDLQRDVALNGKNVREHYNRNLDLVFVSVGSLDIDYNKNEEHDKNCDEDLER